MSTSLSRDETVAATALRVDIGYKTPADARYDDEETEADETDADNCSRRVNAERQRYNERDASNDGQAAADDDDGQAAANADEHERRRLESTRRPSTGTCHCSTWTRRTHGTVCWY